MGVVPQRKILKISHQLQLVLNWFSRDNLLNEGSKYDCVITQWAVYCYLVRNITPPPEKKEKKEDLNDQKT